MAKKPAAKPAKKPARRPLLDPPHCLGCALKVLLACRSAWFSARELLAPVHSR